MTFYERSVYIVDQWRANFGYFIVLQIKYFNSTEEMMEYVQSPDYDKPFHPGLCMGLSHVVHGPSDHEFLLHFNDQDSEQEYNQPSQINYAADRYLRNPDTVSYDKYVREGYSFCQNWLANGVLRLSTGSVNASIVSMTMPLRTEPLEID